MVWNCSLVQGECVENHILAAFQQHSLPMELRTRRYVEESLDTSLTHLTHLASDGDTTIDDNYVFAKV